MEEILFQTYENKFKLSIIFSLTLSFLKIEILYRTTFSTINFFRLCVHRVIAHFFKEMSTNSRNEINRYVPWTRFRPWPRNFPVEIFQCRTGPAGTSCPRHCRPAGLSAKKKREEKENIVDPRYRLRIIECTSLNLPGILPSTPFV